MQYYTVAADMSDRLGLTCTVIFVAVASGRCRARRAGEVKVAASIYSKLMGRGGGRRVLRLCQK